MTTDSLSRAKFRRYRSFVSPGILLIRVAMQGGSTISSLNSPLECLKVVDTRQQALVEPIIRPGE